MMCASLSNIDASDLGEVLVRSRPLHASLRNARVVVTGATGWFGTWLLDTLVAVDRAALLDLRIVAVSRSPAAFARRFPALHAARQIEWIKADLVGEAPDIRGPITHVIHAATESHAQFPDAERTYSTIVDSTRSMLQLASRQADVKLLLISSGAVYGALQPDAQRFREHDGDIASDTDCVDAYGRGKRAAERLVSTWGEGHSVHGTVARCFAFVGPHMPFDAHFAIGNFIRDAMQGGPIGVRGTGEALRSYLYMSDLIVWLLTILLRGERSRPYNVGGREAISIADLASRCASLSGTDATVRIEGRSSGARDYVPDTGRAQAELGLNTIIGLDEAIGRTIRWRRRVVEAARRCEAATSQASSLQRLEARAGVGLLASIDPSEG